MTKNLQNALLIGFGATTTSAIIRGDVTTSVAFPLYVIVTWGFAELWDWASDRLAEKPKVESSPVPKPLSEEERRRVACHEAGHVIVGAAVGMARNLTAVSIVPDGRSRGRVSVHPEFEADDMYLTKSGYRNLIAFSLGGRMAEELLFGESAGGCVNDQGQASFLAAHMLEVAGMGEGPIAFLHLGDDEEISDALRERLEEAKRVEIQAQAARARSILEANREMLDEIAAKLVEAGKLEGAELDQFLVRVQQPS